MGDMFMRDLDPTDLDRQIWEDELADFVPDKVFDARFQVVHSLA